MTSRDNGSTNYRPQNVHLATPRPYSYPPISRLGGSSHFSSFDQISLEENRRCCRRVRSCSVWFFAVVVICSMAVAAYATFYKPQWSWNNIKDGFDFGHTPKQDIISSNFSTKINSKDDINKELLPDLKLASSNPSIVENNNSVDIREYRDNIDTPNSESSYFYYNTSTLIPITDENSSISENNFQISANSTGARIQRDALLNITNKTKPAKGSNDSDFETIMAVFTDADLLLSPTNDTENDNDSSSQIIPSLSSLTSNYFKREIIRGKEANACDEKNSDCISKKMDNLDALSKFEELKSGKTPIQPEVTYPPQSEVEYNDSNFYSLTDELNISKIETSPTESAESAENQFLPSTTGTTNNKLEKKNEHSSYELNDSGSNIPDPEKPYAEYSYDSTDSSVLLPTDEPYTQQTEIDNIVDHLEMFNASLTLIDVPKFLDDSRKIIDWGMLLRTIDDTIRQIGKNISEIDLANRNKRNIPSNDDNSSYENSTSAHLPGCENILCDFRTSDFVKFLKNMRNLQSSIYFMKTNSPDEKNLRSDDLQLLEQDLYNVQSVFANMTTDCYCNFSTSENYNTKEYENPTSENDEYLNLTEIKYGNSSFIQEYSSDSVNSEYLTDNPEIVTANLPPSGNEYPNLKNDDYLNLTEIPIIKDACNSSVSVNSEYSTSNYSTDNPENVTENLPTSERNLNNANTTNSQDKEYATDNKTMTELLTNSPSVILYADSVGREVIDEIPNLPVLLKNETIITDENVTTQPSSIERDEKTTLLPVILVENSNANSASSLIIQPVVSTVDYVIADPVKSSPERDAELAVEINTENFSDKRDQIMPVNTINIPETDLIEKSFEQVNSYYEKKGALGKDSGIYNETISKNTENILASTSPYTSQYAAENSQPNYGGESNATTTKNESEETKNSDNLETFNSSQVGKNATSNIFNLTSTTTKMYSEEEQLTLMTFTATSESIENATSNNYWLANATVESESVPNTFNNVSEFIATPDYVNETDPTPADTHLTNINSSYFTSPTVSTNIENVKARTVAFANWIDEKDNNDADNQNVTSKNIITEKISSNINSTNGSNTTQSVNSTAIITNTTEVYESALTSKSFGTYVHDQNFTLNATLDSGTDTSKNNDNSTFIPSKDNSDSSLNPLIKPRLGKQMDTLNFTSERNNSISFSDINNDKDELEIFNQKLQTQLLIENNVEKKNVGLESQAASTKSFENESRTNINSNSNINSQNYRTNLDDTENLDKKKSAVSDSITNEQVQKVIELLIKSSQNSKPWVPMCYPQVVPYPLMENQQYHCEQTVVPLEIYETVDRFRRDTQKSLLPNNPANVFENNSKNVGTSSENPKKIQNFNNDHSVDAGSFPLNKVYNKEKTLSNPWNIDPLKITEIPFGAYSLEDHKKIANNDTIPQNYYQQPSTTENYGPILFPKQELNNPPIILAPIICGYVPIYSTAVQDYFKKSSVNQNNSYKKLSEVVYKQLSKNEGKIYSDDALTATSIRNSNGKISDKDEISASTNKSEKPSVFVEMGSAWNENTFTERETENSTKRESASLVMAETLPSLTEFKYRNASEKIPHRQNGTRPKTDLQSDIDELMENLCDEDERLCDDKSACISAISWCDEVIQCGDGSDELNCTCKDRMDAAKLCDGFPDCPDGEDELGCLGCQEDELNCGDYSVFRENATCVPLSQVCDGISHCPNHKDEKDCFALSDRITHQSAASYFVGYSIGFLHRNWKGEWWPACVAPGSQWPVNACKSEVDPHITMPVKSSLIPATRAYSGKFVKESLDGYEPTFVEECFQHGHAIYVSCPELPCGSTIQQPTLLDNIRLKRAQSDNNTRQISSPLTDITSEDPVRNKRHFEDYNNMERVVGGRSSKAGTWPWIAAINKNGVFHCGGVILSNRWIMTAAHCVHQFQENYYEVQAGLLRRLSFSPMQQTSAVSQVIVHRAYSRAEYLNDLALLKLSVPLKYNRWVREVCLPEARPPWGPFPGTFCTAIGWGATKEHGTDPDNLHEVILPVLPQCKRRSDINGEDICAGYEEGHLDTCQGDSGGPLLARIPTSPHRWYVAGIVSHGEGCARPNEPGVYTRVALYLSWIIENTVEKQYENNNRPSMQCPGIVCQGRCLSRHRVCDKVIDCLNAEDERDCFNSVDQYPEATMLQMAKKNGATSVSAVSNANTFNDTNLVCDRPEGCSVEANQGSITLRMFQPASRITIPYGSKYAIHRPVDTEPRYSNGIFKCQSFDQVVALNDRCDNIFDCQDGSDERNCSCVDYLRHFNSSVVCDGFIDCWDESDEKYCPGSDCGANKFYCARSKKCVDIIQKCDSIEDCQFGEDERYCHTLKNSDNVTVNILGEPKYSNYGIVTINKNGTWRPLCLQSSDKKVVALETCQKLGFSGYKSFELALLPNGNDLANNICKGLLVNCSSFHRSQDTNLPWHLDIYINGSLSCPAALITPDTIVANYKCCSNYDPSSDHMVAVAGSSKFGKDIQISQNERVIRVDGVSCNGNPRIMVAHLQTPFVIDRFVNPLQRINWVTDPAEDERCVIAGYNASTAIAVPLSPFLHDCPILHRCYTVHQMKIENRWMDKLTGVYCRAKIGWHLSVYFEDFTPENITRLRETGMLIVPESQSVMIDDVAIYQTKLLSQIREIPCNGFRTKYGKCQLECQENELKCRNGKCLSKSVLCDGKNDCGDRTDEPNSCAQMNCVEYLRTVAPRKICNQRQDCADKSDENLCYSSVEDNSFKCADSTNNTLPMTFVCDGEKDCSNGSDEEKCLSLKKQSEIRKSEGFLLVRSHGRWRKACLTEDFTNLHTDALCSQLGYIKTVSTRMLPGKKTIPTKQYYEDKIRINGTIISLKSSKKYIMDANSNESCVHIYIVCE